MMLFLRYFREAMVYSFMVHGRRWKIFSLMDDGLADGRSNFFTFFFYHDSTFQILVSSHNGPLARTTSSFSLKDVSLFRLGTMMATLFFLTTKKPSQSTITDKYTGHYRCLQKVFS